MDVYVAVVRLPDQPHLRKIDDEVELIPGENHWETSGYHIFKDGVKITDRLLQPGDFFTLPGSAKYTAVAVEWSGLESKPSFPLQIQNAAKLRLRPDKPADFSWISERWLVDNKEVSKEKAELNENAVKETIHLLEGVIHRESYNWGQIVKRSDLNHEGKPIRRLFYRNGILSGREYHNRDGIHLSTEIFNQDGYIIETILHRTIDGKSVEQSHFWFDRGMPVKFTGISSVRGSARKGPGTYVKEGDYWVKKN